MHEAQDSAPLLQIDDIVSGYGDAIVVDGISLSLPLGQSMAVLGRNVVPVIVWSPSETPQTM